MDSDDGEQVAIHNGVSIFFKIFFQWYVPAMRDDGGLINTPVVIIMIRKRK